MLEAPGGLITTLSIELLLGTFAQGPLAPGNNVSPELQLPWQTTVVAAKLPIVLVFDGW